MENIIASTHIVQAYVLQVVYTVCIVYYIHE